MVDGDITDEGQFELSGTESLGESDWITGLHPMDVLLRGSGCRTSGVRGAV